MTTSFFIFTVNHLIPCNRHQAAYEVNRVNNVIVGQINLTVPSLVEHNVLVHSRCTNNMN